MKCVFTNLDEYQSAVSTFFLMRAETVNHFRDLSHLIYSFNPKTFKDQLIYSDLLKTLRDLALERQQIEQAFMNRVSVYSCMVILTNAGFGIILLLSNRFEPSFSPLGSAFLISSILLSLDLLLRTDQLSQSEVTAFKAAYRSNLPHRKK
jgi:hypothetical protein